MANTGFVWPEVEDETTSLPFTTTCFLAQSEIPEKRSLELRNIQVKSI